MYIKNYIFYHFYQQYLVLLTMVPRNRSRLDLRYVQERPAFNFVQDAGLIGEGGSFGRPAFFFGTTPPKHVAEPRDCPPEG